MAEISRAFPPAAKSNKQFPARDPRRAARPETGPSATSAVPNVPDSTPSAKPKSYGEKLIESLASLSSEVSTATTLKNEYAKAKKAQLGINQHYEKLRNLSQFPAARDLVSRIRETQSKDVESLKEQLTARKENQKNLTKRAAALVDMESKGQTISPDVLKDIQAESTSTKQSLQNVRDEMLRFTRDSRAASDKRATELDRALESQAETLRKLKQNQDHDFESVKRTRERIDKIFSEIGSIHDRIKAISNERSPARFHDSPRKSVEGQSTPSGVAQATVKALEERVKTLESSIQGTNPTPGYDVLTKSVNQIVSRLQAIEGANRPISGTAAQTETLLLLLDKEVAKIKEEIEGMKALNEYKDRILCDDIEEKQKMMEKNLEETTSKIKAEVASDLEKAISQLKDNGPLKQLEAVASLVDSAELHNQRMETVEIAVRSLESRYSTITAEALAHQAIPLIQNQFPPAPVLRAVVDRFQVIEMHLAQISRLRELPDIVENHRQQLTILQAQTRQIRPNAEPNTADSANSAAMIEMQKNWQDAIQKISELQKSYAELKKLDQKLSSYVEENRQKHEQLLQTLGELTKEKDRLVGELASMSGNVDELKAQTRQQKDHHTALAQSTESKVQTVEQKLVARVKEVQDQIQNIEQRISDILTASGLEDTKQSIENVEVALQQHVENLNYQLTQLVDKHKATTLELSDLQRANEQLDKFTYSSIEDLQKAIKGLEDQQGATEDEHLKMTLEDHALRIDELEQAKASLGRRFRESLSPRSEPSRSPSQTSNWSGEPSRDDDEDENVRPFNDNRLPPRKKNKRKFTKFSGPLPFSSPRTKFGSAPPRGPASMIERSGPPPYKKRQRSMMDLVNNGD
ncbi:adventurous-gliding motility protein Z, putative [Talaromyces stipitatus ATCC 10500]|uniref:Adventurous-gliding motility protein Z, putative n=1 Tax=Talaromyces stipitatus (strain ATCC 10500 / CBS 375.48 / QM 6759 / NRRL 1006) TaxID=441959 RepID=B8MJE9_TALSN|nr:adventurous-gliding motility protein Z, putative [Talaromyces stipitatus ATCC 10500]EED15149.1 adventurous-gliding motility protein Z, putative [Talaromyces stipitatus ATCC 10500]